MKKFINLIWKKEERTFWQRFAFALLVDFAAAFSIVAFIPYEMYLGNTDEFIFKLSEFYAPLVLFAIAFLAMFLIHILLKGKIYTIYTSLVFGGTIASYIQSMYMNGLMKSLDGTGINYKTSTVIINLVIWLLLFIAPAIIGVLWEKKWKAICAVGTAIVIGAQSIALISLFATAKAPNIETKLTTKGIYDVSDDDNVIIFALDRFDQKYVDLMLEKYPDALNEMKGFTYYPNTTAKYCYTHIAVPYMLTGVEIPEYNPTNEQYVSQMNESPFFNFLKENVGNIGVYTNEFCIQSNEARQTIDNCVNLEYSVNQQTFMVPCIKASLYRVLPFSFKTRFVYDAAAFNNAVTVGTSDNLKLYNPDSHETEAEMMEHITQNGLNVNKEYNGSSYKFIHLKGAHDYFQLSADAKFDGTNTSLEETVTGVFKVVGEYCKALDELGLFEDATIIVTADHGFATLLNESSGPERNANPLFMYKPAGVSREEAIKTDLSPAAHEDMFATVVKAFGGDYSEFGETIEEATKDPDRKRYYYWCYQDPEITDKESAIHIEYEITGDARDNNNWRDTGNWVYPHDNPKHKDNK